MARLTERACNAAVYVVRSNTWGIRPNDYEVLKLLPLSYVAWADGKTEGIETTGLPPMLPTR
jgi:hypothetical protein